jgi:hypothetical protein
MGTSYSDSSSRLPILLKGWEQRGSSLKGKKNEDEGKKDRENPQRTTGGNKK